MQEQPQAINRLNALMKAGYKINEHVSQETLDSVWLIHPSVKRLNGAELILSSDGFVSSFNNYKETEQLSFSPEQVDEFNEFVRVVPTPTIWEETAKLRINVKVWTILIVFWIATYKLFNFAIGLFK